MGYRVHVIRRQPEYGHCGAFSYKYEDFKNLLSALGCDICGTDDMVCSPRWEVSAKEYAQAIKLLAKLNKGEHINGQHVTSDCGRETIIDEKKILNIITNKYLLGDTLEDVLETMEIFEKERDHTSDYVMFDCY